MLLSQYYVKNVHSLSKPHSPPLPELHAGYCHLTENCFPY